MSAIEAKLKKLYDRLDHLGDLRDRGYAVPTSDIVDVKKQIELLEELTDAD